MDTSKLKAFWYNKLNTCQLIVFTFDWRENIMGKGENAGNQHFLLFSKMFSTLSEKKVHHLSQIENVFNLETVEIFVV